MKKSVLTAVFLLSLCRIDAYAATDLNDANILEQYFSDMPRFRSWYQMLGQQDKNQVLAGTVVLCKPDLTEIALQNGGDVQTPVYVLQQSLYHNGEDLKNTLIYTYGLPQDMMADAHRRSAGVRTFQKMNSTGHQALRFTNVAELKETSLWAQALKNRNTDCSCAQKIRLFRILSEHGTPTEAQTIIPELLYSVEDDAYPTQQSTEYAPKNGMDLLKFVLKTLPQDLLDEEVMTAALIQAQAENNPEVVSTLKDAGFKIYPYTQAAYDGLLYCAANGELSVLQELIHLGVNPEYKNTEGQTAITVATEHQNPEIVNFLQETIAQNHEPKEPKKKKVIKFTKPVLNMQQTKPLPAPKTNIAAPSNPDLQIKNPFAPKTPDNN
ncbi:MAG: ankyrin repeat domain-containing protein [Alphaproteobacteria bacterium]|nr:ankyrin repeat domain-containing protein [Alphaproteobacteria bacterium]